MTIRKMELKDLACVSSLCIDAFMNSVASMLSEEGIKTFQSIASIDGFTNRIEADNEILVYEENGEVTGVLELKEGRHIAMLFVSPDSQKKGIGRALISSMLPYVRSNILTVSASLTSIPAYLRYGFECTGAVAESAGLKYQPMEIELNKLM